MSLARTLSVCAAALVSTGASLAQHTFPALTIDAIDVQRTHALSTLGVPAGTYWKFSATTSWGSAASGAWSSEARLQLASAAVSGGLFPAGAIIYAGTTAQDSTQALASAQGLNNSNPRSLTWSATLRRPYVALGGVNNPPLFVGSRQVFPGTSAQWGSTSITLLPGATPPNAFGSLDPLATDGSWKQTTAVMNPSAIRWFRFTTSAVDRTAGSALDIDTEGTSLSGPAPANATAIALYNAGGLLIATDTLDGSGSLSQLTFGRGGRGGFGTGAVYDGRDGDTLPAGTYYLAVIGGSSATVFAQDFGVSSFSDSRSGTLNVRVRYYANFVPPPPVSIGIDPLIDGATSSASALVASGGPPAWFRFTIPSTVSATGAAALDIDTEFSNLGPTNATAIGLYSSDGTLLATDSGDGSGLLSQLSFGAGIRAGLKDSVLCNGRDSTGPAATLVPGTYYLAALGSTATASFADGFSVTNPNTHSGTITVRVRTFSNFTPELPSATDLGTLPASGSPISSVGPMGIGEVRWHRFTLDTIVDSTLREYLDLDTELAGAPCTSMAIFADDAAGTLLVVDSGDGSGCNSQITLGRGGREQVGNGLPYDGRDSAFMNAGTYSVAVSEAGTLFANGFVAQSPALGSGSVALNVRRGVQPVAPPAVAVDLGVVSRSVGSYSTPGETLPLGGVVWYRLVTTAPTNSGTGYWIDLDAGGSMLPVTSLGSPFFNDTIMGIYSSTGDLRASDDDDGPNLLSGFTFGIAQSPRPPIAGAEAFDGRDGELPAGTWYVGVAQWESGFQWRIDDFAVTPVGSAGGTIGLNIRTNLPAACNRADLTASGGFYDNGAVTAPPDGELSIEDFIVFLAAFTDGVGCPGLAPCNPADLTGAGGVPVPPDGDLSVEDFITFLAEFTEGC